MRTRSVFSLAFAIATSAMAAVPPPSPLASTPEQWNGFTQRAVEAGGFAAWRDALGDQLRADLTPLNLDKCDRPLAALALAQWQFLKDVLAGEDDALDKVAAGENGRAFLSWLLTNRDALEDYHSIATVFRMKPKRTYGLDGWREIWTKCPESRQPGLWRRVATACAISFAEPRGNTSPCERFDFYRSSHAAGQLIPYFDQALPFELALTVHAGGRGNDDLEWAQDVTPKDKKTQSGVGGYGHSLVAYRLNNYRGQSVQGPEYFDHKPNDLALIMEYGSVCGGISNTNMTVANAHGEPAFTCGQPGHCAYVWKSDAKTWSGGNFVSGWMETHGAHQQAFWLSDYSANINLVSAAVEAPGFSRAQHLTWLGNLWRDKDPQKAEAIFAEATKVDPQHYAAWVQRIEAGLATDKIAPARWRTIAAEIGKAFPKFPIATTDLLERFDTKKLLSDSSDAEKIAYVAATARSLTAAPANEQWDLIYPAWQPWFARQLGAMGFDEKNAKAIVEANLPAKRKADSKTKKGVDADSVWAKLPPAKRPQVEALFASVLPAVESNSTIFKGVASSWLALVAEDETASARAGSFFQKKLAATDDLRGLEMLSEAVLNATRPSADARATLVSSIRKRAAATKKPDPAKIDNLLGMLAQYEFRDSSRIGGWKAQDFTKGAESTLEWDLTPLLAKASGQYALHLNFRWSGGDPVAVKAVRLFEDGKEISADTQEEKVDETLRPAVFTVQLPRPKQGARYVVRATAVGGDGSTGVVLSRAEPVAQFNKDDWAQVGGWGGKEIKNAPEVTDGWHELEFDASTVLREAGPVFVLFKYSSYSSPRIMNVRLCVDGKEISTDLHSCNPISGGRTMYSLQLPPVKAGVKVTVRALFSHADGWGGVYVRKQYEIKSKVASR